MLAQALSVVTLALSPGVAHQAIPPEQPASGQAQQQQPSSGDITEPKNEAPSPAQASPPSAEPKPNNGARSALTTQATRAAGAAVAGPIGAAVAPTAVHHVSHIAKKVVHHRRRHHRTA